jgi:hypothetical protein
MSETRSLVGSRGAQDGDWISGAARIAACAIAPDTISVSIAERRTTHHTIDSIGSRDTIAVLRACEIFLEIFCGIFAQVGGGTAPGRHTPGRLPKSLRKPLASG